jgi:hypothetical protein
MNTTLDFSNLGQLKKFISFANLTQHLPLGCLNLERILIYGR